MTLTIFRITLLRLWNNPLELLLAFVVPVIFFSLFAMIFSHGISTGQNKRVRVGVIDPAKISLAVDLTRALQENDAIDCKHILELNDETSIDSYVRTNQASGNFDLLIKISQTESTSEKEDPPLVTLITDGQNPVALAMVQSMVKGFLLQQDAQQSMEALSKQLESTRLNDQQANNVKAVDRSFGKMRRRSIPFEPRDVDDVFKDDRPGFIPTSNETESSLPAPLTSDLDRRLSQADASENSDENADDNASENASENARLPADRVVIENPQADGQQNPRVAMYAAGIAVLFLLFSATGNAATLLEEQEVGTLDRILASRANLTNIVLGKWLGIFFLGLLQITIMFVWADFIFGIHLRDHIPGFCVMTASTSAATASFAMFLATLSKSRAQLSALSVLLILSMSALGGSMIPRFAMSDRMKEIGKWTFNAWAIDGYQKVFWYQLPVASLHDETMVLCGSALILGMLSYVLSSRWKTA